MGSRLTLCRSLGPERCGDGRSDPICPPQRWAGFVSARLAPKNDVAERADPIAMERAVRPQIFAERDLDHPDEAHASEALANKGASIRTEIWPKWPLQADDEGACLPDHHLVGRRGNCWVRPENEAAQLA